MDRRIDKNWTFLSIELTHSTQSWTTFEYFKHWVPLVFHLQWFQFFHRKLRLFFITWFLTYPNHFVVSIPFLRALPSTVLAREFGEVLTHSVSSINYHWISSLKVNLLRLLAILTIPVFYFKCLLLSSSGIFFVYTTQYW